jgi:hypothetical protein
MSTHAYSSLTWPLLAKIGVRAHTDTREHTQIVWFYFFYVGRFKTATDYVLRKLRTS